MGWMKRQVVVTFIGFSKRFIHLSTVMIERRLYVQTVQMIRWLHYQGVLSRLAVSEPQEATAVGDSCPEFAERNKVPQPPVNNCWAKPWCLVLFFHLPGEGLQTLCKLGLLLPSLSPRLCSSLPSRQALIKCQNVSDSTLGRMLDKLSDRMSGCSDTFKIIEECGSNVTCKITCQNICHIGCQTNMLDRMSEYMSDKVPVGGDHSKKRVCFVFFLFCQTYPMRYR